jgi:hypothetical protein
MSDTYGFPQRRGLAEKLGSITPTGEAETIPDDRVDDVAVRHGFVSREPEVPYKPEREVGPVVTLHTRAPIRVANPFRRFCEANRFSYWEGIEELMKRAGVV